MIVRVNVVLNRTVVDSDRRFDNLPVRWRSVLRFHPTIRAVACENIRFSTLFSAGDVLRKRPHGGDERGETDVFEGYPGSNSNL